MKVGPTRYSRGGRIYWSFYEASGETAIVILAEDGQPELTATVALWPPSPRAEDPNVWLKVWGPNEGIDDALVKAGVVTLTDTFEQAGFCQARLATLTPEAIADRDLSMDAETKAAKILAATQ